MLGAHVLFGSSTFQVLVLRRLLLAGSCEFQNGRFRMFMNLVAYSPLTRDTEAGAQNVSLALDEYGLGYVSFNDDSHHRGVPI